MGVPSGREYREENKIINEILKYPWLIFLIILFYLHSPPQTPPKKLNYSQRSHTNTHIIYNLFLKIINKYVQYMWTLREKIIIYSF